jgi:hypothetical protein
MFKCGCESVSDLYVIINFVCLRENVFLNDFTFISICIDILSYF